MADSRQALATAPRRVPLAPTWARLRLVAAALANERALVLALTAVGLVAHGLNMFNYPAFTYKDDEGIYAAQAWAVVHLGRLAPYTYFYDHAPGGWLLLALWTWLTHGAGTFGNAIDSGRMFMLLLHLAMIPLVYRLARKLGCPLGAAALAALLFSLSPLAVFYQRLLLLDTIMLFWVLLSLDLLLDGWGRLSRVVLSGLCFGLAVLTKETAIVLAPALLFIAVQQRRQHQGRFALGAWVLPCLAVVSWYPLYALLKGELFPTGGQLLGVSGSVRLLGFDRNSGGRVSLIEALFWQASRSGGGLLNLHNQFWQLLRGDWIARDALLCAGGALATGINLARGIRDRRALAAGLLGALPLAYLARGGVVLDYYILVALPFLCLNLAVLIAPLFLRLPLRAGTALAIGLGGALLGGYLAVGALQPLFDERPDQAGREAVAWIRQNVPPQSRIIARDDLWPDLHEADVGSPVFPNVHSHWKVASDPAIRDGVFHNDWRSVDYLIMTPRLENDFAASGDTIALQALAHAHLVKRWTSSTHNQRLHPAQIVELWKVDAPGATEAALLAASAAYIDRRFGQGGAFAGPDSTDTSESQAYALLRAAWFDDRPAFDRVWQWTQDHLLEADGLLAWQWRGGAVIDAHTAADADTDAALALLLAGRRWHEQGLIDAGTAMAQAIWTNEVTTIGDAPYLVAGDWAVDAPVVAFNPSYFAPYAYHIFAEVDPGHNWQALVDAGYRALFAAAIAPLGGGQPAGLPPDWVGIDRDSGAVVPLELTKGDTTQYGYDAARTYWRVALDRRWTGDGRADAFLRQAGFLRDEVQRKGYASAVYAHDGTVVEQAPSMVGTAGALAALLTLDPNAASSLYDAQIVASVARSDRGALWGDPSDLYGQEWGWFATAFYAGALPDLWHAP